MFEEIKELAQEYTEADITLDTELRSDLGLTSFDLVSLLSEVEEKYGVQISEEDIASLITVKDLIEYINKE